MSNTHSIPSQPRLRTPSEVYPLHKRILGRLWACWGLVVFLPTLLIAVVPIGISFWVPEPHGMRLFKASAKAWMTVFLYAIGCPLKIKGRQNHDPNKNYVVVCNHSSLMDVPLLTPFFPGTNKTIAKKSMAKVPIFGWVYTRGSVLVERNSDASRRKSYEQMKAVLAQNLCMAIYPEGTRNRTGQPLKPFYDGAFRLAIDTQKDIIPVVLYNTAKAMPPGIPFFLWPMALHMHIMPPVSVVGTTPEALKQTVFDGMWKQVQQGAV
ncbi:MAG: 1-acyl-sn-glycerol-3-phosphate acyltransferase [Bacteroidetes bacterium]|nr:MAG: 1-acyl-sn-glycerol-3-phosphate acyltransferase [Bacteroidota bacterium]